MRPSKFDVVRIIGERANQIAGGAPSTIDTSMMKQDALLIAEAEYRARKIPLKIEHTLPNGTVIVITMDDISDDEED